MFSHNHSEQLQVVRDMKFRLPIVNSFIVGSVTPYSGKNPSVDVVYLDPDTMLPVELECFAFDIDYANKNDKPLFYKAYSLKELYSLPDLSPRSMLNLAN